MLTSSNKKVSRLAEEDPDAELWERRVKKLKASFNKSLKSMNPKQKAGNKTVCNTLEKKLD